ncbi:MAG: phenylacetic acid catabolic family protein [Alphaproteobacteria bacterium]|nr:phenylacetic acid catabolic family protein [Alphaproteobacteria bacterium]
MTAAAPQVKTIDEFAQQSEEYQTAVRKIVRSHAINELYGAQVFDEPAIALAPTPYAKWLTCRVAMEEYGHHVRFKELGEQIGIPAGDLVPRAGGKRPLSLFDFRLENWPEFCVLKLLGDLAEILQVEDLLHCSFHPLRNLARMTMPEERFHAQFGEDFCIDLCEKPKSRAEVQGAVDRVFPILPAFFGQAGSKNNEIYRRNGIKLRTNEEMRADYIARARVLVEDKLGLRLPPPAQAA